MSIEPTQADRDAAFNTGLRLTKEEWLVLYDAFARHRLASTPASGEGVAQWRRIGTAPWWDGLPDHTDGGGPYEERTLYAAPSHPAADLVAILHQYRSDMMHPPAPDSRERRIAMIDAAIAKFGGDA